MGWFGDFVGYDLTREELKTRLYLIAGEIAKDNKLQIVEKCFKSNETYVSFRNREGDVTAVVILYQYHKKEGELSTKTIHENDGPVYYKPTKKLLMSLTPTDKEWANEWRKESWKQFKNIPIEYQ